MPVFRLSRKLTFPPAHMAIEEGLLAVGGDLSVERLLQAYRQGIFPWYTEDDPILWWSPDPRLVLYPEAVYVSRSLRKLMRRSRFTVTMDTAFGRVIRACAGNRGPDHPGTWIVPEMISAYERLHAAGLAHSVEAWEGDVLAGGLYGVSLGGCFFGESMFARTSDASKVAFVWLVRQLQRWGFRLIDCQVHTGHLASLGACDISRQEFSRLLAGSWPLPAPPDWVFDDDLDII